jgi:hypothetical protein
MNPQQQPPPPAVVMQMIMGRFVSHAIGAAARLDLAEHLASGPKTAEELGKACGAHGPSVYRLLRALASVGVFAQQGERFTNTPLSETLRSGAHGSVRPMAIFMTHPDHIAAWAQLPYSVNTGASGFEKAHGAPPWDLLTKRPELAQVFNDAMTSFSGIIAPAVAEAYDFTGAGVIADIGGGHGLLLATVLNKLPGARGVLFDLPSVVAGAKKILEPVAARCEVVGGDFFKEVPGGADIYMMKSIIHDWSDEDSIRIMKTIHKAAKPAARLLLIEAVIQNDNSPDMGKLIDLEMLVMTNGGRERTEPEFAQILQASGWKLSRVLPTKSPLCVIEATRV